MYATQVLILYPIAPSYSLCNDNISWLSLLNGLVSLRAVATAELHLALHNPNLYGLNVKSVDAVVTYKDAVVGTGYASDHFDMAAGHVLDVTVLARVETTFATATAMLIEYNLGRLLVDIHLRIDTQISLFSRSVYANNATFVIHAVDLAAAADRALCLCQ